MTSGALISGCYRYRLWREVDPASKGVVVFVMLNPSTADESVDDPTIRRCLGFARQGGFGRLIVVNLFALRSTDPRALAKHEDPVGPGNDGEIVLAVREASLVIAAWGAPNGRFQRHRETHVLGLIEKHSDIFALAKTKDGHPRHPLYLPKSAAPSRFRMRVP